jgi:putative ABC transport system permease protein
MAFFDFIIEHYSAIIFSVLGFFGVLLVVLPFLGKVPLSYSIRNLLVRWKITLMTMTAFTLIVALLVGMLAFVNGMFQLTANSSQPGNVIVLADGALDEAFSSIAYNEVSNLDAAAQVIRDEKDRPLASWEVYVVLNQPIKHPVPGRAARRFLQIRGVDDPARSGIVHGLELRPGGQWFDLGAGVVTKAGGGTLIQVDLGEGMARELGKDANKPSLEVGDIFEMADIEWIVTGIMKSSGSTFDSEIWAKRQLVGDHFGNKTDPSTCVLKTPNLETARLLVTDLNENFVGPSGTKVQAQTEVDYYDKLNGTNRMFLVGTLFVTGIMAFGGIFGIMNTMFAAISQRTKDIGVLRIIGFTGWQVLVAFFLESLFLALIGGLLGCAVGCLAHGHSATSIAGSGGGGGKSIVLHTTVNATILAFGLMFSMIMGAVGGLIPALFAMRVKPLESLR